MGLSLLAVACGGGVAEGEQRNDGKTLHGGVTIELKPTATATVEVVPTAVAKIYTPAEVTSVVVDALKVYAASDPRIKDLTGLMRDAQAYIEKPTADLSPSGPLSAYSSAGKMLGELGCKNPTDTSVAEAFFAVKAAAVNYATLQEGSKRLEPGTTQTVKTRFSGYVPANCPNPALLLVASK